MPGSGAAFAKRRQSASMLSGRVNSYSRPGGEFHAQVRVRGIDPAKPLFHVVGMDDPVPVSGGIAPHRWLTVSEHESGSQL